ncbi:phosphoenolpyruvate--protein phosphotransferase [Paracidovorax anthurii]|uniref:phosphoenolpyruvate--protein phosphotransferase n=1 Tax=Paracidovorax anthurii TaxID=78229 RepID=A0A328Z3R1_9BURK|nr:phosphoenolpyruvate--protein phosphotransferase [Paracidovorax anthurii]RAR80708.1 phosphocarrier protein HPr /phosphoenolpyruvate--protein phosphotransferase /PTS system D-fructose-specific IIA component (F1P-forming) (Frc family) [Paracidovorax anthurii]
MSTIPVEVRLGAAPHNREDAVRAAGALLAQAGHIQPAYVESLLQREKVANTFLGEGLAIPHGMVEDKHLVRRTGLAVLQVPAGVRWGDDAKQARLVVAIAAASDEHIQVLRRLTRVMRDGALMQRLATTADAQEIVRALTADAPAGDAGGAAQAALEDFPLGRELSLNYPGGLHARPAGEWARAAGRFQARVHVRCGDTVADAKSVAALLGLGAGRGAQLRLSAQGPDAPAALAALHATIVRLGEEESRQAELSAARQAQAQGLGRELGDWQPAARHTITGIAASPGLVLGTLVHAGGTALEVEDRFTSVAAEAAALDRALAAALAQLERLAAGARAAGHAEQAGIFAAHQGLLQDAGLLQAVSRAVVQRHGAAWAWRHAMNERVAAQRALPDATLAARAADLQDVGERVLRHLLGRGEEAGGDGAQAAWPEDAILLADDLSPSVAAQIDTTRVRGFCTARGGPTAHTAILARALGLPAVVAAGPGVLPGQEGAVGPALAGAVAILDGYRGRLYVAPSETALVEARERIARLARRQEAEARTRREPATTTDGHTVEIAANVNRADQAAKALEAGAEGVGLMRTEFLFLERDTVPDEEAQYAAYRAMVEALAGRPLVVRTLDIGGDKRVPHLDLPVEENPFLGVRGARLALRRDDLLVPQLRALYRAAAHGPLQVMFPMISTVEEVHALRARMEAVRAELRAPAVPVGIMIEVPSAALIADRLAAHVDFFSIGTNDLTQYALAVDRQHPELAGMADSLHPAVLRLVERTVAGARRHGRWVGVCGGLAGEPLGAALLAGLGVQELSMSTGDIGGVKALLRRHSLAELQALAHRALDVDTADEVRALGAALRPASE